MEQKRPKIIVVTGPESTGKTAVCQYLAKTLSCHWFPEFARDYVEELDRPYTYDDVVAIAQKQVQQFQEALQSKEDLVVFDTGLLITQIWFELVYQKCPAFVYEAMDEIPVDLYLLCKPDIPWVADNVRENGGAKRMELYQLYKAALQKRALKYQLVSGSGEERFLQALACLKE